MNGRSKISQKEIGNSIFLNLKVFFAVAKNSILIVLFTLGLLVFSLTVASRLISSNADKILESQFESMSENIYKSITHFDKACDVIAATSEITTLTDSAKFQIQDLDEQVMPISRVLNQIIDIIDVKAEHLSVFFPELDYVVTSEDTFSGQTACNTYFRELYGDEVNADVLDAIPVNHARNLYYVGDSGVMVRQVTGESGQMAFILLKFRLSDVVPLTTENALALIGNKNSLIYSNDSNMLQEQYGEIVGMLGEEREFSYNNIRYVGKKQIYSILGKDIIIAIPTNEALLRATWLFRTIGFLIVLVAALAVVSFCSMNKKIIRPIVDLLRIALDNSEEPDMNRALIATKSNILSLKRRSEAMQKEIDYLIPIGLGGIFERINNGTFHADSFTNLTERSFSLLGFEQGQAFLLTGFCCSNADQQRLTSLAGAEEKYAPWYVLDKLLKDSLLADHVGVLAMAGDCYILACAFLEDDEISALIDVLGEVCEKFKLHFSWPIIRSQVYTGKNEEEFVIDIKRIFNELSYLRFWQVEEIPFAALEERPEKKEMSDFKMMRNMINKLDNADYDGARIIFNKIIDEYLPVNVEDLNVARNRVQGMMEMLISAVEELFANKCDTERLDKHVARFYRTETLNEFRVESEKIFEELLATCAVGEVGDNSLSGSRLMDEVLEYVNCHYTDNSISLGFLAERYHISKSYLSRTFKQKTGTNLLEYIQNLRIREARKQLEAESVNTVAKNVGFWDTQGFIRVFKKVEGITPGEYKAHKKLQVNDDSKV